MSSLNYLHGPEVIEVDTGVRPIRTAKSSIIGVVGSSGKGPVNTPILISGSASEAAKKLGAYRADGFTLPEALDGIMDQAGCVVVAINVCDPARHSSDKEDERVTFLSNGRATLEHGYVRDVILSSELSVEVRYRSQGITLPEDVTVTRVYGDDDTPYSEGTNYTVDDGVLKSVDGSIEIGNSLFIDYVTDGLVEGVDYTIDSDDGGITRISSGSIMPEATVTATYTFVDADKVEQQDVLGGTSSDGHYTGIQALLSARSEVHVKPRILSAPHWTHQKPDRMTSNAQAAELISLADRMKAVVMLDGPNTTDEEAITYRNDFGSDRAMVIDPWVKVTDPDGNVIHQPASARFCGVISRTDQDSGFWWSLSNKPINGIVGTSRAVEFNMGDYNCRANYLNENEVTTIIRENGYRTWGNRSTTGDSKWAFLSVRRTADMIQESILESHLWATDRPISKALVDDLIEGVNAYMRTLKSQGAILGGRAWASEEDNTPTVLQSGQLYVDFEFTAPPPAEHITFRSHLVNDYFTEVFG